MKNQTLTSFLDKEGSYAEVLAVLPSKVVLLYADEKTDTVDTDQNLKVGDRVYFDSLGCFSHAVSSTVSSSPTVENKQSPIHTSMNFANR